MSSSAAVLMVGVGVLAILWFAPIAWVDAAAGGAGDTEASGGRARARATALAPAPAPRASAGYGAARTSPVGDDGSAPMGALDEAQTGAGTPSVAAPESLPSTEQHPPVVVEESSVRPVPGGSFGFDFRGGSRAARAQRPFDGPFLERYDDGRLALEGEFDHGQRDGEWRSWYPEGAPHLEGQYLDGRRVGRWKAFHPNGQVMGEGEYRGGFQEGSWTTYYSNGQIKEQGYFEHDLRIGQWQFYDSFGQLEARSGFYRNGHKLF
ncbi:MAG: toxin-antitoxin system YwqK family antitoxin [Planctomycetota bacterium]